jgi:hypothetical protein
MLITEDYRKTQQELHKNDSYGTVARQMGGLVGQIIDKAEINTVLDYGSGHNLGLKETLKPKRPITYSAYDPGVDELAGDPEPAELVCVIDVLEHIEPGLIDNVFDHIEELTQALLIATICTCAAKKVLPDGRNAHLIQQPVQWWLPKFWERDFEIQSLQMTQKHHFLVIAHPNRLEVEH